MNTDSPRSRNTNEQEELKLEDNVIDIVVIDFNGKEIPIKVISYESVIELREYLAENVYTFLFTNYFFEHQGARLGDYQELASIDLASHPRINMRPCLYDDKAMIAHVQKLQQTLITPPVLSQPVQQNQEVKDQKEVHKGLYHDFADLIKAQKPAPERGEQEFHAPVAVGQQATTKYSELFAGAIQTSALNKVEQVKCIEGIQYSPQRVTPERRMLGDLMYLLVRTLEQPNLEQVITCSANGFYRSEGNFNSFSSGPSARQPCYSYTLAGCLNQMSPQFSERLQVYLSSILRCEPYFMTQPIAKLEPHWIIPQAELEQENRLLSQFGKAPDSDLFGFELSNPRDWNEEYQVVKAFPIEQLPQKIQRERALHKIYTDFVEAATKGAMAIINKRITALNPAEPQRLQVFVYNQIFFSFATDQGPDRVYADLTKVETSLSYAQVNHDLTGLRLLQTVADVDKLHNLATCVVHYKGQRVICQTIVPGILNNNDLSKLAEYGPVEERKNYKITEEFHHLMLQVAETLSLKTCKVVDPGNASGASVEIAGSADCRGIRGTDRRCYLVEMQGMLPRDANLKGENFATALARPELVSNFQQARTLDFVSEKIKPFNEKLARERPSLPMPLPGAIELNEEQKKQVNEMEKAENMKKIEEIGRLMQLAPKIKFNVNVFRSGIDLDMPDEEIKADEALVEELATFLKTNAIRTLIHSMKQIDGTPNDSESIEQIFHQHGVNMRYLGFVINELKAEKVASQKRQNKETEFLQYRGDFSHLLVSLEKEVFLRSAKHVINAILREECDQSDLYLAKVISHILNCILAPFPLLESLDSGAVKLEDDSLQTSFQFFPEETFQNRSRSSSIAEEEVSTKKVEPKTKVAEEEKSEVMQSKKSMRRKAKKEQKKQAAKGEADLQESVEKPKNVKPIEEILFGYLQRPEEEQFKVSELFQTPILATGLNRVTPPGVLSITPKRLYEQIYSQAKKRFHDYELPAEQTRLKCLQSPPLKSSLLRDLCKAIGIQIVRRDSKKEFVLTNNLPTLVDFHSAARADEQKTSQTTQRRKNKQEESKVTTVSEEEILNSYDYLPFNSDDISKIFPVLKTSREMRSNGSSDIKKMIQSGKAAINEGHLEFAYEQISQAINISMQIYGPMNTEIAACLRKLGSLQSKFGDLLQAIEMQTKAIVMCERLVGRDHPEVAESYSSLAVYFHTCGLSDRAFQYMYRALEILEVSVGDMHPSVANLWQNLAQMYCEVKNVPQMTTSMKHSIQINRLLYGKDHLQVANSHAVLAQLSFASQELRGAVDNQEKAHAILIRILPEGADLIKQAKGKLDVFLKHCVNFEKNKVNQTRAPGTNPKAQNVNSQVQKLLEKTSPEEKKAIVNRYLQEQQANQDKKQMADTNYLDYLEYQNMRDRQAAAQRFVNEQNGEEEKKVEEKLDYNKVYTIEKLSGVLTELDLEFLEIHHHANAKIQKMKDDKTWQEAMIIRYRTTLEEEMSAKAQEVLMRHGFPGLTLTKFDEWTNHFRGKVVVKEHVQLSERLQLQVLEQQNLQSVSFPLPPTLTPEVYVNITSKLYESMRYDLWKEQQEKKGEFAEALKNVEQTFDQLRLQAYNLFMDGAASNDAVCRTAMQQAYVTYTGKIGFKWADEVEAIISRHNNLIKEMERGTFAPEITVDPRSTKEVVAKEEPAPSKKPAASGKAGYLAKFKEKRQKKVADQQK